VPQDLLDRIHIPTKLTEIRAYVRWEEAGKPEDTALDWQARELPQLDNFQLTSQNSNYKL
jgi:hypothetical protein